MQGLFYNKKSSVKKGYRLKMRIRKRMLVSDLKFLLSLQLSIFENALKRE